MSEENINILRRGYEAFNRGDIDTVLGLMDENIEWNEPEVEGLPEAGTHRGPEQVARNVFQPVVEDYEAFQVTPEKFLDANDHVVVLGRFQGTGKATGRALDAPFAHVWVLRDGKLAYFQNYTDTAQFLRVLGK
jgi:ketosteroid isomerase-like protein